MSATYTIEVYEEGTPVEGFDVYQASWGDDYLVHSASTRAEAEAVVAHLTAAGSPGVHSPKLDQELDRFADAWAASLDTAAGTA